MKRESFKWPVGIAFWANGLLLLGLTITYGVRVNFVSLAICVTGLCLAVGYIVLKIYPFDEL